MARNLSVTYGMDPPAHPEYPEGLGWVRPVRISARLHLAAFEYWNDVALCGVQTNGNRLQWSHGVLCPKCAAVAGVKSTDDLHVDEEAARPL